MVGAIVFVCMILAAAASIAIYMRMNTVGCVYWAFAVLTVLILVPFTVTTFFALAHFPSRVDASALADLSAEQVGRVEYIFAELEGREEVTAFRAWERDPDAIESALFPNPAGRGYSFRFRGVHVMVFVYSSPEHVAESRGRPYSAVIIENDNSTGAALFPTRSGIQYLIPSSRVSFRSIVRVGNVVFDLTEFGELGSLRGSTTNQFIALVVEMLQE